MKPTSISFGLKGFFSCHQLVFYINFQRFITVRSIVFDVHVRSVTTSQFDEFIYHFNGMIISCYRSITSAWYTCLFLFIWHIQLRTIYIYVLNLNICDGHWQFSSFFSSQQTAWQIVQSFCVMFFKKERELVHHNIVVKML